jgi:hypothetical protein
MQAAGPPPPSTRTENEVMKLKEERKAHQDTLHDYRCDTAEMITHLDLMKKGMRIYNCGHNDMRDLFDDQKSTMVYDAATIARDLFMDWCDDEQFVKVYTAYRRELLKHHRAHERVHEGRGVASWMLKKEFVALDEKRGVPINY